MKNLTESFKKIEKSLSFLGICSKATFFPNVKKYARDYLKYEIEENDLFKILSVCPNIYTYSWELNEKKKEHEIYLYRSGVNGKKTQDSDEISSQKNIGCGNLTQNLRLQLWIDSLYIYLLEKHDNFLEEESDKKNENPIEKGISIIDIDETPVNNSETVKYDYETEKNWHPKFLESADFVPDFGKNFPRHKTSKKTTSLKDLKKFLNKKSASETQSLNIVQRILTLSKKSNNVTNSFCGSEKNKDGTTKSDMRTH